MGESRSEAEGQGTGKERQLNAKSEALEAIIQTARNMRGRLVDDNMHDLPAPILDSVIETLEEERGEILGMLPDGDPAGTWIPSLFSAMLIAAYTAYRMKAADPDSLAKRMLADDVFRLMIRSMEPLRTELLATLAKDAGK